MTLTTVIVLAARFVLRTLELLSPVRRATDRMRNVARRMALALGLDKPVGLAQGLTGLAVTTLVVLCWIDRALIAAWGSFFSTSPISTLLPMSESTTGRLWYHVKFDVATLGFGFGLFKVVQLRNHTATRDGTGAIVGLACVIAIMVLMNEWPYRTFSHRDFERVDLAGVRCYIIGEAADEVLVLCPGSEPPRNRTLKRDDPELRRLGVIENIFRGIPVPGTH